VFALSPLPFISRTPPLCCLCLHPQQVLMENYVFTYFTRTAFPEVKVETENLFWEKFWAEIINKFINLD
jgi:hypothetical protein